MNPEELDEVELIYATDGIMGIFFAWMEGSLEGSAREIALRQYALYPETLKRAISDESYLVLRDMIMENED